MRIFSRSFLLPFSLTVVVLLAAMHLGVFKVAVAPARATSPCPHTGCHGSQMCVWAPGGICALHGRTGPCTTYSCN